ncbi:MAG: sulfite exporter TauE/SafE family protein, partial [Alphaproteobacteria bacterium]
MIEIVPIYLAAGVFSGIVSGLFGVGGAFALAPALILTLSFQGVDPVNIMHLTIATALATQVVTAILTTVLRYRAGDLLVPLVGRLAPFVAAGAIAGAAIGDALPGIVLQFMFIGFVAVSIVRALLQQGRRTAGGAGGAQPSHARGPAVWFLATLSGASGGVLGPGPAILLAPQLRKLGFTMPVIAATSASLAGLVGLTAAGGYILGGIDEPGLPAGSLGYLYLPGFFALTAGAPAQ